MTERAVRRTYADPTPLRTYSHLAAARKIPDDYDITTTALHYYVDRGFEVETPIGDWYETYQAKSPLQCSNWDLFADPARTTYSRYTAQARDREAHVDGILRSIDELGYDSQLQSDWLDRLEQVLGPVRYPLHGLQMIASYAGSMAPGGRITIALMFQAGHEMRRIQRLTYRMVQLRGARKDFGMAAKTLWQEHPAWQPLRKLIERLLVTYDWGESLVALNLCVKPMLDAFFVTELAAEAVRRGDPLFGEILISFSEESAWQRAWSAALVETVVRDRKENREAIDRWISRWVPETEAALEPLSFMLGTNGGAQWRETAARHRRAALGDLAGSTP